MKKYLQRFSYKMHINNKLCIYLFFSSYHTSAPNNARNGGDSCKIDFKDMDYIKIGDLYFYGNVWKPWKNFDPRRSLEELPMMKGRDDDVLVCGCHRSGTNWMWEIVNMLVRETTQYQRDRKTPTILEFQTQDYFDKMKSPRVLSTHLHFHHIPDDIKKRKCKMIYIQRNPKDVAVSFHHHIKCEADLDIKWEDYLKLFVNADEAYYTYWIGNTISWDKAIRDTPDYPILLVYYEKLKKYPFSEIRRIAEFLEVSTDEAFINDVVTKTQFTNMKTAKLGFLSEETKNMSVEDAQKVKDSRENYYRKGEVADWKNHFTVAQNEYFDKVMGERLKDTKLEFIYDI